MEDELLDQQEPIETPEETPDIPEWEPEAPSEVDRLRAEIEALGAQKVPQDDEDEDFEDRVSNKTAQKVMAMFAPALQQLQAQQARTSVVGKIASGLPAEAKAAIEAAIDEFGPEMVALAEKDPRIQKLLRAAGENEARKARTRSVPRSEDVVPDEGYIDDADFAFAKSINPGLTKAQYRHYQRTGEFK